MLKVKKEYVIDDDNQKKAVLIDIKTYEKMEEILENFGLAKYMEEVEHEESFSIKEAREYYNKLEKSPIKGGSFDPLLHCWSTDR